MQDLIRFYNELLEDIKTLEDNAAVHNYIKLKEELAETQEKLKDAVKLQKSDIEVGIYNFVFQPKWRKWIDFDKAAKLVGKKNQPKLEEITTFEAIVDMKKFIELVRSGKFPESARIGAYCEEEMSPSVLIKEMK